MAFRRLFIVSLLFVLGTPRSLHAVEADTSNCLEEIKTVCMGLEERLENCLNERGKQLVVPCKDLLKNAVSMAEATSGPGVCVNDIKVSCPTLDNNALAQCIVDKKMGFSPACREYLDAASNQSSPSN